MKKKLTALFLALVMCMTMSAPALAVETDPYADLRESIYLQLEAQDALHLYDDFVKVLIPNEGISLMAETGYDDIVDSWPAEYGGVLHYTVDYTYRGEDGFKEYVISYMDYDNSYYYVLQETGFSFGDIIVGLLGEIPYYFGDAISFAASTGSGYISIHSSESITNAHGFAKVVTIYDSISDTDASVASGWEDHTTIILRDTSARDYRCEVLESKRDPWN